MLPAFKAASVGMIYCQVSVNTDERLSLRKRCECLALSACLFVAFVDFMLDPINFHSACVFCEEISCKLFYCALYVML